eukprot:59254-Hanusia_phi.AAC.1
MSFLSCKSAPKEKAAEVEVRVDGPDSNQVELCRQVPFPLVSLLTLLSAATDQVSSVVEEKEPRRDDTDDDDNGSRRAGAGAGVGAGGIAFLALVSNIIESFIDSYKLCHLQRRPLAQRGEDLSSSPPHSPLAPLALLSPPLPCPPFALVPRFPPISVHTSPHPLTLLALFAATAFFTVSSIPATWMQVLKVTAIASVVRAEEETGHVSQNEEEKRERGGDEKGTGRRGGEDGVKMEEMGLSVGGEGGGGGGGGGGGKKFKSAADFFSDH